MDISGSRYSDNGRTVTIRSPVLSTMSKSELVECILLTNIPHKYLSFHLNIRRCDRNTERD